MWVLPWVQSVQKVFHTRSEIVSYIGTGQELCLSFTGLSTSSQGSEHCTTSLFMLYFVLTNWNNLQSQPTGEGCGPKSAWSKTSSPLAPKWSIRGKLSDGRHLLHPSSRWLKPSLPTSTNLHVEINVWALLWLPSSSSSQWWDQLGFSLGPEGQRVYN